MYRTRLNEELTFSKIIMGFWRLCDWNMNAAELAAFMNECVDRGITTFDIAEIYGNTEAEKLLGETLKTDPTLRDRIEIVSKTGIFTKKIDGEQFGYYDTSYDRIMKSCKESLKRMNTDHLDLYLIHREDPLLNPYDAGRALKDLKKAGLIRAMGASNFDPFKFDALNKVVGGKLVTNQIEWNPVCFEHFNSGMMDYLMLNKIHPMIWSPLAGGRLFNSNDAMCKKAYAKIKEIAVRHNTSPEAIVYAWIMYHPVGAMPIVGSSRIERVEHAIVALDVKLERYEWYEIYTASGQQILR